MIDVNRRVLPGFGLSLGYTALYLSLVILIPMAAGVLKATTLSFEAFLAAVSLPAVFPSCWEVCVISKMSSMIWKASPTLCPKVVSWRSC